MLGLALADALSFRRAAMTTKVKGLFKGLKSMFDNNCKEPEMQIGYPTDVKHVAHIGWDGPSVNSPSWMNEFRSTPDASVPNTGTESTPQGTQSSRARDLPELPRPTRRNQSSSEDASPTKEATCKPKHSRRQQQAGDGPDAPRHPRRPTNSAPVSETPQTDTSGTSKNGRRKKSKGSSGGGSTRTRPKPASYSDADVRSVDSNASGKSIEEEEKV